MKKRVNRDKCSFTTKQHMFRVFAYQILSLPDRLLFFKKAHCGEDFCFNSTLWCFLVASGTFGCFMIVYKSFLPEHLLLSVKAHGGEDQ